MEKLNISSLKKFTAKYNLSKFISNETIDIMVKNNPELVKILDDIFEPFFDKKIPPNLLHFDDLICERIIMRYIDLKKLNVEINIEETFDRVEKENLETDSKPSELYLDYIKKISKYPILNRKEEEYLFKEYNQAKLNKDYDRLNYIRNIIFKCNLGLVITIVKKYSNSDYQLMDRIQEGNIKLFLIIDKFDITKENKFSTFAQKSIKNYMITLLNSNQSTNSSSHYYKLNKKISAINNKYLLEYNRNATDKELSEELGVSIKVIKNAKENNYEIISYNHEMNEEDSDEFIELFPDKVNMSNEIIENIQKEELKEDFDSAFIELSLTQQRILNDRFFRNSEGYGDITEKDTFENVKDEKLTPFMMIGDKLGISHQGVMSSYNSALHKLEKKLQKYYEEN